MQTIVLARTIQEVYEWARAQERGLRTVRYLPNADSLQGSYFDKIVELPSFNQRADKYAINAAIRKLLRRKSSLERIIDSEWVRPTPPKRVPPVLVDPAVFRFSNLPVAEMALGDMYFKAVSMEAEEDFSIPEVTAKVTVHDTFEAAEVTSEEVQAEVGQIADDLTQLGQEIEAATGAARPKRKGRRTNEQKAFDEAQAAYGEDPTDDDARLALKSAEDALRQRHPDDERLAGSLPDLDF